MMIWEAATRRLPNRIPITVAALAGLYVGASLVMTRSPVNFIATGMTLDPWTGFYRMMIWEWGLQNVWDNPWAGLGSKALVADSAPSALSAIKRCPPMAMPAPCAKN